MAVVALTAGASAAVERPAARGEIVFRVFEGIPVAQCGGLFAVDPATRRIRALASDELIRPSFPPNGAHMTVARFDTGAGFPRATIFRYDRARGTLARLVKSLFPWGPIWSPRGDRFLVYSGSGRKPALRAVETDTGRGHTVVAKARLGPGAAWSGGRVVYTLERRPGRYSLWTAGPDGRGARLLAANAVDPVASPKGGWVAFWPGTVLIGAVGPVTLVRADGSGKRRLAGGPYFHRGLAFSPDGRRLALMKKPRNGPKTSYDDADLVVQPVDATRAPRVVARNVIPVGWSPGGRRLLILRPREVEGETVFGVSIVDMAGKHERLVAVIDEQDVNGDVSFPAWNPRGGWIAPLASVGRSRSCVRRLEALRKRLQTSG